MSLDVLRGATIASMLLVNNPGNWNAVYAPLRHAEWHGWTFTDTIFPFFIWIVGVAIPLSVARRLEAWQSRRQLFRHALRRAAILFGLGLFLAVLSHCLDGSLAAKGFRLWLDELLTTVRLPGVLQRIAVCYLTTVAIFLTTRLRGRITWVIGLLLGYWALMALAPFPLTADGATRYVSGLLERGNNFSAFVDDLVLNGPVIGTHVWKSTRTWDPEGLVSTLPALATCLLGALAGQLLRAQCPRASAGGVPASALSPAETTAWLMVGGALLMWLGLLWNLVLPINKNLWTSSYAVFMAGLATTCLGVCYWLVDVQGRRRWAKPFAIYGMNALAVFVLAGVLGRISIAVKIPSANGSVALKTWLYNQLCAPFAGPETAPFLGFLATPENASLLWALLYVALFYLVAWGMYRKKRFVKL
jgi:predicted acyltransferase